ncbi:DUF58 domain-containing protein [Desulfonema ishimotonii]|uniref:DUF58 domain-containing protein n=1 Tax=Desulfonema ishimotonii TaxID=45657 RepID=A0A401FV55_9BACT|nr:DUF58 domain-containing protein [Desulfonema ishimotonii]GBC60857.1 DUF58 domain-containing protein [Desulfonema ishimotonii]
MKILIKRLLYIHFRLLYAIKRRMLERFTAAGLLVLFGAFTSGVLGLDTRRSMSYQIFTFLVCLLLLAVAWGFFSRLRFSAERIMPRFGTAGEPLTYQLILRNNTAKPRRGLSFFENLQDPRPDFKTFLKAREPGEEKRNFFDRHMGFYRWEWLISRRQGVRIPPQPLPVIPPGGSEKIRVRLHPRHRGVIRLTGLTLAWPDPFGLFNSLLRIPLPREVVVLPRRYSLPSFRLPGSRRFQSGGVALTSSVGDSEEFVSLRDYRAGDPLRKIHWKSWARMGRPMVREFQEEFFVRHALVLDTFHDADDSDLFEEAVSVAASFACTVQTQESLLDLIFVGPESYCFTAGRGLGETEKTLEILASVRPCLDKPFSALAASVIERAGLLSGCICVLLSWDTLRREFVRRLRMLGVPVLVLVITDALFAEPGDDADACNFHQLKVGKIEAGLAKL